MSDPDALRSIFEDHSDLEMDNLTKPNPILKLKRSLRSIRSLQASRHQQCPIMALPIDLQPTPTVTPVVSELSAPVYNNMAITFIIPTDPLFPPHLRPQRPYHVGEDITEVGRGMHFIRVEDRDDINYWITCRMDNTGVEFSMRVGRDLVIDPNPQDMLSWLARVGSLMRLWWGHLSELVRWS